MVLSAPYIASTGSGGDGSWTDIVIGLVILLVVLAIDVLIYFDD